jgi:hypothetical protein
MSSGRKESVAGLERVLCPSEARVLERANQIVMYVPSFLPPGMVAGVGKENNFQLLHLSSLHEGTIRWRCDKFQLTWNTACLQMGLLAYQSRKINYITLWTASYSFRLIQFFSKV